MIDQISKLLEELKTLVVHVTYVLSESNISELLWKIDQLKTDIFKMYEGKKIGYE